VLLAFLEQPDLQDRLVLQELQDSQVLRVIQEIQDFLGRLEELVQRVHLASLDQKDFQAAKVVQVARVQLDRLVQLEPLELEVRQDCLATQELQDQLVHLDPKDQEGHKEQLDLQD